MSSPPAAPDSLCILRLSAIGDACHVLPVLRTLQQAWPRTRFTWVIGAVESRLMGCIEEVEFIIVDKRPNWAGAHELARSLAARRFDALLHMQVALRASLIARRVRAARKIGFDRARARELQWLFTDTRIAPRAREHVLDSFFGFAAALGVPRPQELRWDFPLPPAAQERAAQLIPDGAGTLLISPCSSHRLRDWRPERYAAAADHATRVHGLNVILCGGSSPREREMGAAIEAAARTRVRNLIGRDTLPELLALLARARALITPDSGPAHMATMVRTPVIGLYAATNPERSGPYLSRQWCVNAYAAAAHRFRGRPPEALPWTEKIEEPGVMDLITVEEVTAKLDGLLAG